jgi:Mn-dependent DtxR family transcriptional regulator
MGDTSLRSLLRELDERGPVGVPALAETLDAHPVTVDLLCYDLQADGYVDQTSSGVYDITEQGRTYLNDPGRSPRK